MNAHIRYVEPAAAVEVESKGGRVGVGRDANARRDAPHVDRTVHRIEGRVQPVEPVAGAQIHGGLVPRSEVVHALIGNQPLEELDGDGGPARHIHDQLFEREQRALAAAIADGVGHLGAPALGRGADFVRRVRTHQIADIGDHPRGAGLDELVVVELLDVLFEDRRLPGP